MYEKVEELGLVKGCKGCEKLEYLESTGTQYINTDIIPNQDTTATLIYENTSSTNYTNSYLIGSMNTWGDKMYAITPFMLFAYNTSCPQDRSFRINGVRYKAILDKNHYELSNNGTILFSGQMAYTNFSSMISLTVFANHTSSGVQEYYIGRIFELVILQNDTLVRDYIPVLDANDRPCLFDKVSKTCFYNQGTGEYIWIGEKQRNISLFSCYLSYFVLEYGW